MKKIIFVLVLMTGWMSGINAQNEDDQITGDSPGTKILVSAPRRLYMGNGYDLLMFSSAAFSKPGQPSGVAPLRVTGVNPGVNLHYDMNRRFGLFTGLGLKNLGFIEKKGGKILGEDYRMKHRVYTIGAPLGIKFGDLRNRNFVFAGGGIDIPLNYRQKAFINSRRNNKIHKSNEWLSKATPYIMPYIFLGMSFDPGFIIKAQYYPGNFFNQNYEAEKMTIGYKPFAGYKANIFALSLSIDIHYNQYKIQEREYRKGKAGQYKEKQN